MITGPYLYDIAAFQKNTKNEIHGTSLGGLSVSNRSLWPRNCSRFFFFYYYCYFDCLFRLIEYISGVYFPLRSFWVNISSAHAFIHWIHCEPLRRGCRRRRQVVVSALLCALSKGTEHQATHTLKVNERA